MWLAHIQPDAGSGGSSGLVAVFVLLFLNRLNTVAHTPALAATAAGWVLLMLGALVLLALGLFLLVLNVLMVYLTAYLIPNFHVTGFIAALLFSILVSIVTALIDAIV